MVSTAEELIASVLPREVATAAATSDPSIIALFPEEEASIARAVEKRRAEFATARLCARRALARLGVPPSPLVPGEKGAPSWPDGIVGSLTHCRGYRAAAVARIKQFAAIGIDAETHEPLPHDVLGTIALQEEARRVTTLLRSHPQIHWDRLLFSFKEAVYKAWYPLLRRPLGFHDALIHFGAESRKFEAQILPAALSHHQEGCWRAPCRLRGLWTVGDGLIVTAVTIP